MALKGYQRELFKRWAKRGLILIAAGFAIGYLRNPGDDEPCLLGDDAQ